MNYSVETQLVECELCGKQCSDESAVKKHHAIVHGDGHFFCHTCGYGFKTEPYLARHNKAMHNRPVRECSPCKMQFDDVRRFKMHQRNHDYNERNMILQLDPFLIKVGKFSLNNDFVAITFASF